MKIVFLTLISLIALLPVVSIAQESESSADTTQVAAAVVAEDIMQDDAVKDAISERGLMDFLGSTKYILFFVISLIALGLLLARFVNYWVRIGGLILVFLLYGLDYFFPLHPSPMCGFTKLFMFRFTWDEWIPAFLAITLAMLIPSLIGRKLFCGWVCPLGAFQELINKLPFKWRYKKFNFTAFNSVRFVLLAMFVIAFFHNLGSMTGLAEQLDIPSTSALWRSYSAFCLYDPINFFELLHWEVETLWVVMMVILVISSLILYRPFCYMICPIGAVTWLFEKIAPGRIRVDENACNKCMECVEASPCPTIEKLVDQKDLMAPDCTSCGECVPSCKLGAIKFGFKA